MTSTPSPPPGWYPDPGGEPAVRWWDGTVWTETLRPAPDVPARPGTVPGPIPPGPVPRPSPSTRVLTAPRRVAPWQVIATATALVLLAGVIWVLVRRVAPDGTPTVDGARDSTVSSLSAGDLATCAVRPDHRVICWGGNRTGELGDGTTTDSAEPVEVLRVDDATEVAAGSGFACAVVAGGSVRCWGENAAGQLGDGTTTPSPKPVEVQGVSGVRHVVSGRDRACALRSRGTVTCWGLDLGASMMMGKAQGDVLPGPFDIPGLAGATQIDAGGNQVCAVMSAGGVRCVGDGASGQLGNGANNRAVEPVDVIGLTGASQVATGDDYSCALLSGGTVKCWGWNGGQPTGLSDDATVDHPVEVPNIIGASSISVGQHFGCAVAAGRVHCWGSNFYANLGNGGYDGAMWASDVTGISTAWAVSAGEDHACAAVGGGVRCWGANGRSQLGHPTAGSAGRVPVDVEGLGDTNAPGPTAPPPAPGVAPTTVPLRPLAQWPTAALMPRPTGAGLRPHGNLQVVSGPGWTKDPTREGAYLAPLRGDPAGISVQFAFENFGRQRTLDAVAPERLREPDPIGAPGVHGRDEVVLVAERGLQMARFDVDRPDGRTCRAWLLVSKEWGASALLCAPAAAFAEAVFANEPFAESLRFF